MSKSKKALSKVEALSGSLDELEKQLEPLFAKPLPETLGSLETIQQAKLNVVLPYLINDLIFIYLKTVGVDPKTHPVIGELERVRNYFAKIQGAEDAGKKRTTIVDRAAAGRFIKHAISEAKENAANNAKAGPSTAPPQPSIIVPVRVTEKMREREKYQQELAVEESDSGNDEVLEIIDDDDDNDNALSLSKTEMKSTTKARGSPMNVIDNEPTKGQKKRTRPMDPFGSFGKDDEPTKSETTKRKKKAK